MRLSQKPSQRRSSLHMSAGVVAFQTLSLSVKFDSDAQAIILSSLAGLSHEACHTLETLLKQHRSGADLHEPLSLGQYFHCIM